VASLDQISRRRNLLGKVGACCCLLLFLALLDGLVARFREPFNVLKVLPGTSLEINGPLQEEAQGVGDLTYTAGSPKLRVSFEAMHKGYFLGGDMWRGRLLVDPQTPPGEYPLTMGVKGKTPPKPLPPFQVIVFADALSLQDSDKSLLRRHWGLSPWGTAASFLPAILLCFGGVFLLSQKRERLLMAMGRAEIYRVASGEGGCVIGFGLGTDHGLQTGSRVRILDNQEHEVGTGEVQESTATDSLALVHSEQKIKPGYIVCRRRD